MTQGRGLLVPGLDPEDWIGYRAEAHAMLDAALDLIEGAGERPVWQPVPPAVKAALATPSPQAGLGLAATCAQLRTQILAYATGNTHPRFFGWVHGTGTPGGVIAEMLAAAMNANVGGRDHGAVYVERQVVGWCRDWFSLPATAGGLLTSGTSMATLIGLAVARNRAIGPDARRIGLTSTHATLTAYASSEAHSSVAKALELLGIGSAALRLVPVDADFAMDAAALADRIDADIAAGRLPFAVIATAGTVNTGGIDPIEAIAALCRQRELWLHVDGAFGAVAVLSEALKPRLAGIEQADSIAFDFHKWLHVPYDAGCLLVRDVGLLHAAFSTRPHYLAGAERGLAAGDPWFCELGPELSRGFRALKVWFTVQEHGTRRLGQLIEQNCRQARYLADQIGCRDGLELMAPVPLNIVCFRYRPEAADAAKLDALNADIVTTLQMRGIAAPSTTRIAGSLAIRVNLTNHRTQFSDLDLLLDQVIAIGKELHA